INEYPDQGVVVGYIMQNERTMYEYRRVCNNTYSGSNEGAYREAVLYSENTFGLGRKCGVMLCGHVLNGTDSIIGGMKSFHIYNGLGMDERIYFFPENLIENKERVEKYKELYLNSDWAYYVLIYEDANSNIVKEEKTGKFWD
ncbi:MAG: hypothetical protein K5927_03465, partial [Lachnospiraceae bacterium]|nr:hypothetical protein [Lachnospiraceae bacterium]